MPDTTTKPLTREDVDRIADVIRTEESPGLIHTQITALERQVGGKLIADNDAFKLLLQCGRRSKAVELWRQIAQVWNLGVRVQPVYHVSVRFTGSPAGLDQSSVQAVRTKVLNLVEAGFPGARDLTVNITRETTED